MGKSQWVNFRMPKLESNVIAHTARSVEDETRNAELNGIRNPECWGNFSQLQI